MVIILFSLKINFNFFIRNNYILFFFSVNSNFKTNLNMKAKLSLILVFVFATILSANAFRSTSSVVPATTPEAQLKANIAKFTTMTPREFEQVTGKKMTLKETIKFKAVQKVMKNKMHKDGGEFSKGLFILLAIFGWAWLLMGIQDDWSGSTWVTNLILTLLCGIPGLIHALIKMKDYTK